ncbi:MAG: peptidylprolyl isomerase [Ignavibacteriae bacterium]|nr:peptidylprolyl isomerase [Ignavibacteriota bacterium]
MGMMARMRSLAPWFIITVGGLFVLFMVLSDSKVSDIIGKRTNDVGSINGVPVSYQEYSNLIEQYRKDQAKRTGQEIPEVQMDAFRDQVWENLVAQKLIEEKIKELGITVTDQEILDIIQGPNPPQIITQYFIDSTGKFNRQAYDQAIYDPQNKNAMIQTEAIVKQQLIQQKLASFLNASVIVSDDDVKNSFIQQNMKISSEYAFIDINTIADNEVQVSDNDLEEYYKKNPKEFEVEAQRELKYVLFSNGPTKDDSLSVKSNLEAIAKKISGDTTTFKSYVQIYSEKPYSLDTVSITMLGGKAGSLVSKAEKGSLIGPVLTNEGYVIYKLENTLDSKDSYVRASHILVKTGQDENAAKTKIDGIYNQLMKGANFETTAKQVSEDGSAKNGGDLGWFGKGQMVKEFENAAFSGKIGEIQKPVKSQFGYHIIKVTGKSDKKYVVEKIVNEIKASATTLDKAYDKANDFAYIAKKNGFESEAGLLSLVIKDTPPIMEKSKFIPGIGSNMAIVKFAFENGVDEVSPVFKVPAGYIIETVSKITNAGKKSFDEVKEIIKSKVIKEKKFEKAKTISENIKNKIGSSENLSMATEVYAKAKVSGASNYSPNGNVPGVGRDLAFTQATLDAKINEITDPVKGVRGYFLIKVTERTPIDSTIFSIQKNSIRENLLTQKKNMVFSEWIEGLKKDADIEDNRYLFFR